MIRMKNDCNKAENLIIFNYKCGLFFEAVHIYCESLMGAINWGKILCYTVWVEFWFSWDTVLRHSFTHSHALSFDAFNSLYYILVSPQSSKNFICVYFECCLNAKTAFKNISKFPESKWTYQIIKRANLLLGFTSMVK